MTLLFGSMRERVEERELVFLYREEVGGRGKLGIK